MDRSLPKRPAHPVGRTASSLVASRELTSRADLLEGAAVELRRFLTDQMGVFQAREWLDQALGTPGKLSGEPVHGFTWALLPLMACQACAGDPRRAYPVAIALDCLIAAVDVLDDIEDDDAPDALHRRCGLATATNVATALLFLSQAALGELIIGGVPPATVTAISQVLANAGVRATIGQQDDLTPNHDHMLDVDRYLTMIGRKSAGFVEAACHCGALLGQVSEGDIEAYCQAGYQMGLALQIGNDIVGASTARTERNDLRLGKPTLPLIYAMQHATQEIRQSLADLYPMTRLPRTELSADEVESARQLLASCGAFAYAEVVSDICWERARSLLERLSDGADNPLLLLLKELRGV